MMFRLTETPAPNAVGPLNQQRQFNKEKNMTTETGAPQGNPGDIVNWPMLKIVYRTDPDKIAALLPPGISPGANP